jgi:hypothetical protein
LYEKLDVFFPLARRAPCRLSDLGQYGATLRKSRAYRQVGFTSQDSEAIAGLPDTYDTLGEIEKDVARVLHLDLFAIDIYGLA